jgi:hypothetical protein
VSSAEARPGGLARLAERLADHPRRPTPGRHWFEDEHRYPKKKTTVAWLVTLARAGYGVTLVAVPGLLIGLTGQRPGRRDCAVARVLGARHLLQAGVTAAAQLADPGDSVVLGGGVAVDLVHASTMVALGVLDSHVRRAALIDVGVETALAVAGAAAAATSADRLS